MQTCGPRYIVGPDNHKKMIQYRSDGPSSCNKNCIHWKACLIELNGGNERIAPLMSQKLVDQIIEDEEKL